MGSTSCSTRPAKSSVPCHIRVATNNYICCHIHKWRKREPIYWSARSMVTCLPAFANPTNVSQYSISPKSSCPPSPSRTSPNGRFQRRRPRSPRVQTSRPLKPIATTQAPRKRPHVTSVASALRLSPTSAAMCDPTYTATT